MFCDQVNARVHRVTRRAPVEMLAQERARLHPLPATPHTVSLGASRTVATNTPMVTFQGGQYSVPHRLLGALLWVRVHGRGDGEAVIIVHRCIRCHSSGIQLPRVRARSPHDRVWTSGYSPSMRCAPITR